MCEGNPWEIKFESGIWIWGVHTIHLEITGDFRKSDWLSAVQSIHESYDFFLLMTYFSQLYDFLEKVALHLVQ